MKYYLGQCTYKWSHQDTRAELLWIRQELGNELFLTIEENSWEWQLERSSATHLPGDVYCQCNIYVEVPDSKQATLFALKFSNIKKVELA